MADLAKKFDLYYYLDRATERVALWTPEEQAAINYKYPPKEDEIEHAETFDRIL